MRKDKPNLEECGWECYLMKQGAAHKYGVEYFAVAAKPRTEEKHNG